MKKVEGYADVVTLLIRNGADVNHRSRDGSTALDAALREGHNDVENVLRGNGAE